MNKVHFISGFPRSGSTLLGAILRQNPSISAGMSSPVAGVVSRIISGFDRTNEFACFLTQHQREELIRQTFEIVHRSSSSPAVSFDTSRAWCANISLISQIFPDAKIIVCVRNIAWILDSFERIFRRNPLFPSKMFSQKERVSVFSRTERLVSPSGSIGYAWNAVQEALFGEHSDRLLIIDYEDLTRNPIKTVISIYDFIGEPRFDHQFDSVFFDGGAEFDAQIGIPNLHRVEGKVEFRERRTILPRSLFQTYENMSFWNGRDLDRSSSVYGVSKKGLD